MNSYLIMVFGLLIVIGCAYIGLYQHEIAHVKINDYFGSESRLEFGLINARVVNNGFESEDKKDLAYLGHSVNEAVAYNISPLLIMIGIINVLGFVYLGEKMGGKE